MQFMKAILQECKEAITILYSCFFEIFIVTPYLIIKECMSNSNDI